MYGEQLVEASLPSANSPVEVKVGTKSQNHELKEADTAVTNVNAGVVGEFASDFIAGLVGGCAGLVVGHPFDTVKVRQQTGGAGYTSLSKCVRSTLKNDGARGFFKGLAFPLGAVGFLNSIFFGVYGNTIKVLSQYRHGDKNATPVYSDIFLAGSFAGAIQAIPASPIELVKVKLQSQTSATGGAKYSGPIDCLRSIHRQHGLRGCFVGLNATIMREIPGFSLYITSYQWLCDKMTTEGQTTCSVRAMLFAGGVAGMLSWMINIPVDIVKSRIQADDLGQRKYKGMIHCARLSYREEGIRVFWRGLPVICLRAFPTNAVTFAVYSCTLQALQKINKGPNNQDNVLD